MILHYSTHSLSMSKYISTTKKNICDPALRCRLPSEYEAKTSVAKARRAYERSSIELPSIWSWTMIRGTANSKSENIQLSKSDLLDVRDRTPYYPFCKALYEFATGVSTCDWIHVIGKDNESTNNTYNFSCGCTNPHIEFTPVASHVIKSSSAFIGNPEATRF